MAKNKLMACLLAGAMALSLTACGPAASSSSDATQATTQAPTEAPTQGGNDVVAEDASVDFEDGKFAFVAPYLGGDGAGEVEVAVADFNGSKALQITNVDTSKTPYIGIDVSSLLGDKVADVATIEASFGVTYPDGKFNAVVGKLTTWTGEDLAQTNYKWTVYIESKNPNKAKIDISEKPFVAGNKNIITIGLDTTANGVKPAMVRTATIYVDNIRFLDKDGKLIVADTSAEFDEPDGFGVSGVDRSNLFAISNAVVFDGFEKTGNAWAQDGLDMPQAFLDALVPGSVVEISYKSEDGSMWMLFNQAEGDWRRCGQGTAYINNSKNIAQITYEQIIEVYGEDKSKWGAMMQCEAASNWVVTGVKVGQKSEAIALANPVVFDGFEKTGNAWAQDGLEMPQAFLDALVPGSVVEISYKSEDGTMWMLFNQAEGDWRRCGQSDAVRDGSKCYVTYDQIVAVYGDDKSKWGATMQCEAGSNWVVTGVRVGQMKNFKAINNVVVFDGFEKTGNAWAQDGLDMPQAFIDALVPGAVVNIAYKSDDGSMWMLFNQAAGDWRRCGQEDAVRDGSICQVTYEQIVAVYGDDKSQWGAMMQCEAGSNWTVTGVWVGTAAK